MGNGVTTDSVKLTKAQKKDLKEAKKAEQERLEAQKKARAEELAIQLSGKSEGTKKGQVRSDVKDDLKELYKNGGIDKETYKEAKDYAGKGNIFGRIFGKKKDSTIVFDTKAAENHLEKTKEEGPKFSKKLTEKMEKAHITVEDVYATGDQNIGSDKKVSYSWKKRQPGEADEIKADFNSNTAGVEFSKREVKKIMKDAGYKVEHAVNGGKVLRDATIGAAVAAPLAFAKITQNVNVGNISGVITGTVDQSVSLGGFAPAVGAAVAAGASTVKQLTRVEKKVAETDIPKGVQTYEEYQKHNKEYSTKKGAEIMNKIGKFYVADDGKTLNKEAIETDLKKAAGEGSVLNYEEAVALHAELVNGKNKPQAVVQTTPAQPVVPPKETCEVKLTEDKKQVVKEEKATAYKVQKGEYWYSIAAAKYPSASPAELKQIVRILKEKHCPEGMKSTDAFQPKVMHLPETITIGEKAFNLNINGVVQHKNSDKSNVKTTKAASNPFTRTVEESSYGYDACGDKASGLSKEARDAKLQELKKANPNKEYIVK